MIPWGNPGFVLKGEKVVFAEHDPEIDGPPPGELKITMPPASADDKTQQQEQEQE